MKIVTVPHPSLRQEAKPVEKLDKKLWQTMTDLKKTLLNNERRGVGLAAPQVDKQWRMFATLIGDDGERLEKRRFEDVEIFINPQITKTSPQHDLGEEKDGSTPLEGCLSIPKLYGPVPRYHWVELTYQQPKAKDSDELITTSKRFTDFPARLVQHELDHLDGVLFTDYTLEYDLSLYQEDDQGELVRVRDTRILTAF